MQTKKILGIALCAALISSMASVTAFAGDTINTLPYVAADHTFGVIGSFAAAGYNDWSADVAPVTDADGDGVFSGVVTGVKAGSYKFKVRADGAWDYSWGNGADNLVAEEDGTYEVTIVFNSADDVTVTAVKK